MRSRVLNSMIHFRAGDQLASALHERARQLDMSPSEYLRTIVREKVGKAA